MLSIIADRLMGSSWLRRSIHGLMLLLVLSFLLMSGVAELADVVSISGVLVDWWEASIWAFVGYVSLPPIAR